MKTNIIVFKLKDWKLIPHDHPVFSGDVAHDLGQEQEVQVCDTLNVREFNSRGEVITAINDYNRETANPVECEDFYLLERICIHVPASAKAKAKKVSKSKIK